LELSNQQYENKYLDALEKLKKIDERSQKLDE
jgi:hypothetical protein